MAKKKDPVAKTQFGFYLNEGESELTIRPASGSHMIRPPEEGKKKKGPNPYAEALAFENQQHRVGDLEDAVIGFPGGGLAFYDQNGEHLSLVGDTDGDPYPIEANFVEEPKLEDLSPKARGIYFMRKKQREQGE